MVKSKIELHNENPTLIINNKPVSPVAYITYFDERNDYKKMGERGIKLFSISVSLAKQPINTTSGFMPFKKGVFDDKGKPDFEVINEAVDKILKSVPDALIFPRIYVTMPEWWINENPEHTVPVPNLKHRESLYSDKFREDGARMLGELIEYFKTFYGKEHIIGYQISGGNTQEWFHLDLNGGCSENTLPFFNKFLKRNYSNLYPTKNLPQLSKLEGENEIEDELLLAFLHFANEETAKTVDFFCKKAKETVNFEQIVGVFYGYSLEVGNPLWGTHSLKTLLDSNYIDFFSSPNSYLNMRSLGEDWSDMIPTNSVKLHGKMCFIECDIRTNLTKSPEESRKGSDPLHYYNESVWTGPETEKLSRFALRKSLARQLSRKYGLWWFDMFGHWFDSEGLLYEIENSKNLYDNALARNNYDPEIEFAVFVDETLFRKVQLNHPVAKNISGLRLSLGSCGAPYKIFLQSDFDNIDWHNSPFKAVIIASENKTMETVLKENKIDYLFLTSQTPRLSVSEISEFLKSSGVHIYSETGDVFYIGNGIVSLHASSSGEKVIVFSEKLKLFNPETEEKIETEKLSINMKKFETVIFRTEKI